MKSKVLFVLLLDILISVVWSDAMNLFILSGGQYYAETF